MAYRPNKHGGLYGNDVHNTPVGKLFWVHVAKAKPYRGEVKPGDEPRAAKFEISIAFPKETPKAAALEAAITADSKAIITEYNTGKKMKIGECTVFQDGDALDLEKYPWVAGCWVLSARSLFAPPIVDRKGEAYDPKLLAGGMSGKLAFKSHISAMGLSYTLEGIQFWEDTGDRFGGGSIDAAKLFDACEPEDKVAVDEPAPVPQAEPVVAAKAQKGKNAIVNML